MRIVVAGGSGWIGRSLCAALAADDHDVVVLSRTPGSTKVGRGVLWDGRTLGSWASELNGARAVVNLVGESIASGRWTTARKARLLGSRVDATAVLVQASAEASPTPPLLVNASAVGYYGDRGDETLTEAEGPGIDFLAQLVVRWEAAARKAEEVGMRVALMRNAVVLGSGGGALRQLALPFRLFVGGPVGSREAWFPWVHVDDVVGLFRRAIDDESVQASLNVAAGAVPMGDFAAALGQALHRPSWLPVPCFALRLGLGELGEALTISQRIVPEKAQQLGYEFQEPDLAQALRKALA